MTDLDETVEDRLHRLSEETRGIGAHPDFVARVMGQLETEFSMARREDWSLQVLRWSRVGVVVASMAAMACVALAWQSANSADDEEALAYGMSEVFE